ncbi:MAG: membrane protein of unknown function [Candidatus Thorarchaeota archaeon]|nr:MAG: membrane protein of unknown function [Candidatus Thorarchaeota archaeon]
MTNNEGSSYSKWAEICLLTLVFLFLFLVPPIEITYRRFTWSIASVFYEIEIKINEVVIDAPYPWRAVQPYPPMWYGGLQIIFVFLYLVYRANDNIISRNTLRKVGYFSLSIPLLTFLMRILLPLISGLFLETVMLTIPTPFPALLGLYLLREKTEYEENIWLEDDSHIDEQESSKSEPDS